MTTTTDRVRDERLAQSGNPTARSIGKLGLRDLNSVARRARLKKKSTRK
ncbi:MAG TPA: hypothetical protein VG817_00470 [Gemmatimonadales bacterium]|nr:hypothetical protein [Gemmatimonadales bacterium]